MGVIENKDNRILNGKEKTFENNQGKHWPQILAICIGKLHNDVLHIISIRNNLVLFIYIFFSKHLIYKAIFLSCFW